MTPALEGRAAGPLGVLVSNLGTPDEPTPAAVRRYLREFLSDRRVVDTPRLVWLPVLYGIVLTFRPRKSAALYRKVWRKEGSPLLDISKRQRAAIETELARRLAPRPVTVALGMRYGSPSIADAVARLDGCREIVVLPMYPQRAGATTASTLDALAAAFRNRRRVPTLRFVAGWAEEPAYLEALAASVREFWRANGEAERLLFSFHGLPSRHVAEGDSYRAECEATASGVAARLGLPPERWRLAFQSRFGPEEWLRPATDETLREWGRERLASLDVVCPGFPAECLETLEEIAMQGASFFVGAGGGRYRYVPTLDDAPAAIALYADLVGREAR